MTKTQDIRDAVERELTYDPLVDMSDITVKNPAGLGSMGDPDMLRTLYSAQEGYACSGGR